MTNFSILSTDTSASHRDPVCGMTVTEAKAAGSTEYLGEKYFFCAKSCLAKFEADPERYLNPPKAAPASQAGGAEYTCPMDPEVRQIGPGSCPKCGMALEPVVMTLEEGDNPELRGMTRRLTVSAVLSIPVLAAAMTVSGRGWTWFELILSTPVVLWGGWPFFVRGWQSLVTRNLNMFTLIAMGTGIAFLYSVVATLAPGLFPAAVRSADGAVPVYFEAACGITVLVLLGQVLELRA